MYCTLYTDTDSASTGPIPQNVFTLSGIDGLYILGGAILGAANVKVPHYPKQSGPSVVIPFSALPASDSGQRNASVEFNVTNSPVIPNQYFWIAFSTQSAGGTNVVLVTNSNSEAPAALSATSNNGQTWSGNNPQAVNCALYPQLALTSAGATGYGGGNVLTIWDTLGQGNAFQATNPLGVTNAQTSSDINIKTSQVANLYNNRVDVFFPASAGSSTGFSNKFSRWDYSVTVTYDDF